MSRLLNMIQYKLSNFPEDTDPDNNIKIYGEISIENQLAYLSHMIHNSDMEWPDDSYKVLASAIRDFLDSKKISLSEEEQRNLLADVSMVHEPSHPYHTLFEDFFTVPFPAPKNPKFTFVDLFAGMGGFRLAMQAQGGRCVFSSEWNKFAQQTYLANFGEMPFGDITKSETKKFIPEKFDVLCAGFPCQPFSIAGVSKKNSLGQETGFQDKTQGTLFFEVADILNTHRPKAFMLENVKNLISHDNGNTFKVISDTLQELNYSIHYRVLDGKGYVPQHRERIIIVGFDKNIFGGTERFEFPSPRETSTSIGDILQNEVASKYTLSDKLWSYLQQYAAKHKAKGNGFGFGLTPLNGIARTLSARYYKDGSEILIPQTEGMNPRRLTPRECARLMGYPDEYRLDQVSDVQAYRQCGNSVVVPLMTAVASNIINTMTVSSTKN